MRLTPHRLAPHEFTDTVEMLELGLTRLVIFFWFFLLVFAGCATLPRTIPVSPDEELVVRQAFLRMIQGQEPCGCCLDVQVTVKVEALLQKGTIDGDLQLRQPSHLKFVGINPFGQPLLFLATDGSNFRYISVTERKSFQGNVEAKLFRKYAPPGFHPEQGFNWLTGRLAGEGLQVISVALDEESLGYWLKIQAAGTPGYGRILFDMTARQIVRHAVLNRNGGTEMEVFYDDYREPAFPSDTHDCRLPGRIEVRSGKHGSGSLVIFFNDWRQASGFSLKSFELPDPAGFEKVLVQ